MRLRNLLACAVLAYSAVALADPSVPGLRGILGMEAGNYEFVQYNKGELQKTYLDGVFKRSQEDRDYFLATVKDIEAEFVRFVKDNVYGASGLKKLSDTSTKAGGPATSAQDFLNAINAYAEAKLALQTKINSLTSLAGALPSQISVKADKSGLGSVPGYGNIKFDAIVNFYSARLTEIDTFLANLPHAVALGSGVPHMIAPNSGKGLMLDVPAFQFSAEKLRDMRKQVQLLRMWDEKAEKAVNGYTVYVKQLVQRFITTYGTSERYRFQNERTQKLKEEAARDLVHAFWSRSYLRAVYGMPLGAIGIRYQKRMANIDFFTAAKEIFQFVEEPVWDEREMVEMNQNYSNALNVADARASKILDGNVSLLRRANALVTFIAGNAELADALKTILFLMAADFHEEKLIIQPGGLRQMTARYRARYLITDADKAFYKALGCSYDPSSCEQGSSDPYGDMTAMSGGSLQKRFSDTLIECQTMEDRLGQAKEIEAQIANAQSYSKQGIDHRKERRRRLDE